MFVFVFIGSARGQKKYQHDHLNRSGAITALSKRPVEGIVGRKPILVFHFNYFLDKKPTFL